MANAAVCQDVLLLTAQAAPAFSLRSRCCHPGDHVLVLKPNSFKLEFLSAIFFNSWVFFDEEDEGSMTLERDVY